MKADFSIDGLWDVVDVDSLASAEDDEILDVAPAPDFLTILAVNRLALSLAESRSLISGARVRCKTYCCLASRAVLRRVHS